MTDGGTPCPGPVAIGDESFGAYYYANCCGKPYERSDGWLAVFGRMADCIVRDIGPRRVLDAGCAIGLLVEVLRDRGVEAFGIDLSSYAIGRLHATVAPFCRRASIVDELEGSFDLIVCIEVTEHMPAADAEAAIANFCRHTDDVLFSSSPLDYREPTHVNVHPPEHWAELFARHEFFRDVDFDASFVTPWAARFRRRRDPVSRIIRDYERRYWHLAAAEHGTRDHSMELQRQIETLQGQLRDTPQALAEARERIFHMERSLFWKARLLWLKATALGRSRS